MNKFIFCFPEGGLNDILCQISYCLSYAKMTDRIVIADTRMTHFGEPLTKYFESTDEKLELVQTSEQLLDHGTHIYAEHIRLAPKAPGDGTRYSFDTSRNHDDQVLRHQGAGGGWISHALLTSLRCTSELSTTLEYFKRVAPSEYHSAHIRNTDIKTDLNRCISLINHVVKNQRLPVFLASDSRETIRVVNALSDDSVQIFNFFQHKLHDNLPLHMRNPEIPDSLNRSEINTASLVDLFLLSSATHHLLIFPTLERTYSGFSMLANYLKFNPGISQRFFSLFRC
jgi:hypothetical protein